MSKRTTNAQFEIMINFFQKHPRLISGKTDSLFSKDSKEKLWEELTSALNAKGNGPSKSIKAWRKTLKDWKCYVKKKAGRIALQQKQTGEKQTESGLPSREELTLTEEKLLRAIGEVSANGQNSVEESPICEDVDVNLSTERVNVDPEVIYLGASLLNYCGKRKAVKRKIKNSLATEASEKVIPTRKVTNEYQRRMAEVAERKVTLLERQVKLFEMRTDAAVKKATAMEQAVSLEKQKLRQQWRQHTHDIRMKKMQYL